MSFTSTKVNAIALAEQMEHKFRWHLSKLQYPPACHLVVTDANYPHWKEFAPNVESCIAELLQHPELNKKGDAAMYGVAASLPDKTVVGDALNIMMEEVFDLH